MILRRLVVLILAAFCLIPAASGDTFMLRATTRALSDSGDAKEKTSTNKKTSTKKKESAVKKDGTKHPATTEEKKSTPKAKHHSTTATTKKETKKAVASEDAEQPSGDAKPKEEEKEKPAAVISKEDSPDEVDETKTKEGNDESQSMENDEPEESKSVEEDPDKESEPVEKDPDEEDPDQKAASDQDEPDNEAEQDETGEANGEANNESQEESTKDQGQESDDPEQQQKEEGKENEVDSKDNTEIKPEDGDSDSTTTDPCHNITECSDCEKVDSESISEDKACAWKDSKCQLVDKDEVPSESICETEAGSAADKVADGKDEEDASFTSGFVTIAVVVGILFAVRTYAESAGIEIPGVGNPTPRNGSGRSSRNHETVPLAGADDDDWGWEDSAGGDVELPTRTHPNQEEEDLRMAMALSLSESPTVPPPKQIGNATRRMNSGSRVSTPASTGTDDWDDWDDDSSPAPSTRVAPAPVSAPAPAIPATRITSLGTAAATSSRQTSIRKPQPPKPKQDDIFASMGLAAKPIFSSPPPSRPSAPPTTSGLAAAAQDISADSADWGDDSDLDDLLDD